MNYFLFKQNHLNRIIKIIVTSLSMSIVSACGVNSDKHAHNNANTSVNNSVASKPEITPNKAQKHMTITGTLRYQNIEGGFFGFIAHDGQKYMLSGLDDEFRKNGIELELEVSEIEGAITFQQFGKSVKVHNVKVIDASKVKNNLNIM